MNNEYNLDIAVNLPSGKRFIEITNAGGDWFYLDWVRLERVLPAAFDGNWLPAPDAIGLRGSRESLLYVIAPGVSFPANATNATLPLQQGQTVTMTNWPNSKVFVEWYNPANGGFVSSAETASSNNNLTLLLPDFREDLAGIVYPPPALKTKGIGQQGGFEFQLDSETGGRYLIQVSTNLSNWELFQTVTNSHGTLALNDPFVTTNARSFFRARQQ